MLHREEEGTASYGYGLLSCLKERVFQVETAEEQPAAASPPPPLRIDGDSSGWKLTPGQISKYNLQFGG